MTNKALSNQDKQFTILSNEADPKTSLSKASQAAAKALSQIRNTKPSNKN